MSRSDYPKRHGKWVDFIISLCPFEPPESKFYSYAEFMHETQLESLILPPA